MAIIMAPEILNSTPAAWPEQLPTTPEKLVADFYDQAQKITDQGELFKELLFLRFTPDGADHIRTTELLMLLVENYPPIHRHPLIEIQRLVAFAGMYDLPPNVVKEVLTPMDYDTFMTYVRNSQTDELWQRRVGPTLH